jgi:hypothetical protein
MELTSDGDEVVEHRIDIEESSRLDGGQELSCIALLHGHSVKKAGVAWVLNRDAIDILDSGCKAGFGRDRTGLLPGRGFVQRENLSDAARMATGKRSICSI